MQIGVHYNTVERGPGKVVENLLKGMDKIGIPYVLNSEGEKNIILQATGRLSGNLSNCVLGPNICTLPTDNPIMVASDTYAKVIVPCKWVNNLYTRWIPQHKIETWPVGIDTDIFTDCSNYEKEIDFLVYYKRRSQEELRQVLTFLEQQGRSYTVIAYGSYTEADFLSAIRKSRRGIVIAGTESQGIAIQEMMSCNLPLLVWDVREWIDRGHEHACSASAIPYWDYTCGEVFYQIEELEHAYSSFINQIYNPRQYVVDNLNLATQATKLVNSLL